MAGENRAKPWSHHESHKHCGCCGRCSTASHYVLGDDFCANCAKHLTPARVDGTYIEPWNRTYFAQHGEPCPLEEAS